MISKTYIKFVKVNKSRIKMKSNNEGLLKYIQKSFSVKNDKGRKHGWTKGGNWSKDDISCISDIYTFKPGLSVDIIKFIKKYDMSIKIDISEVRHMIIPSKVTDFDLLQPNNEEFIYHDYQEEAIRKALKVGRGCFIFATSAGKSLIMYGIVKNSLEYADTKRVLVVVPNISLLNQFTEDFVEYGFDRSDICKFGASKDSDEIGDQKIIITNVQYSFKSRKGSKPRIESEIPDFDLLLVDECHGVSNGSLFSALLAKTAKYRSFGFTGTESEWKPNEWEMIGLLGPVLKTIRAKELQDRGFIAKNKMISVFFEHGTNVKFKTPQKLLEMKENVEKLGDPDLIRQVEEEINRLWFPMEWEYIEDCSFTNKFVVKVLYKFKGNTIILFDHIEHGKKLYEYLKSINKDNKRIYYIDGKTKLKYRDNVRKEMELYDDCFLIGNTRCIGTGMSIKNIRNIGFGFSSGKAVVKIIQAIGRGLRLMDGKSSVNIIDFYHSFFYSKRHFVDRLKLYDTHYGIEKDDFIIKAIDVPYDKKIVREYHFPDEDD